MVSVKLKGVNTVRKRLADGTVKVFYYHRATGARLPDDPSSDEFQRALADAKEIAPKDTGTVAALIRVYQSSLKFEKKRESTKREYRRMLIALEGKFGTMPLRALRSPKVRGVFLNYHEEIGRDRPREADNRLSVLSAVFSYAASKGDIHDNPIKGFDRLYTGDRAEIVWTERDVAKFMKAAPLELQQALILAIHTGQRYGDLIRLRWADYDGASISLTQSKTGAKIDVRASATLKQMLDRMARRGPYILTRPDGRPWFTEKDDKALSKAWREHMDKASMYAKPWADMSGEERRAQLHFNDLRGTAITLLAEAGCTIPEIVSITGHTMQSATRILERYMKRTKALASAAIIRFENAPETSFANRLQTAQGARAHATKKDA